MRIKIYLGLMTIGFNVVAQQNPTGSAPPPNTGLNIFSVQNMVEKAWYRGGNSPGGSAGNNNIFGTMWNSPIYTKTDGQHRTRLNGTLTTSLFGVNQNVSGYFGISPQGFFANNSPWAMLHLDGPNNTPFLGDWRRWMRTGVYMRENSDAMYVGLKEESGSNRSDAVINWSDDAMPGSGGGIDKLRFIFTSSASNGNGIGTDPRNGQSLEGYEFMRMQSYPSLNSTGFPVGHIGIGPLFSNSVANSPKSRLHSHTEDWFENYFQFSNENYSGIGAFDGLKVGTGGYFNNPNRSGHAYIYNQENRSILLSTNHAAPSAMHNSPTDAQNTGERVRITSIGAPTNLTNGGNAPFGVWNPGGIANQDVTRVAISHNPATPVTRPLALLHLGYNTGSALNPTTTDGWRSWMDVGMFIGQSSDNVYLGLKNESTTILGDRYDAVLSWGDNQINSGLPPNNGPDNFRFIFTSSTTGSAGGTGPAIGQDGLEGIRLTPTSSNGVYTGIGGSPSVNPYTTGTNAGNTLEINSWGATNVPGGSSGLRFTNLNTTSPTTPNPGYGVLAVNTNGDVIYVNAQGGNFGASCASTTNAGLLPNDWHVGMNGHSVNFEGIGNVNIGDLQNCIPGSTSPARLWVRNTFGPPNPTDGFRVDNGTPNYAATLMGNVFIGGTGTSPGSGLIFSDKTLKENIVNITSSMEIIQKLKPVSYNLKASTLPQLTVDVTKTYGLIAQDVETILPELVKEVVVPASYDSLGAVTNPSITVKSLNYTGLIPFTIGAIQEVNVKQQEMQANLDKLNLSDAQVKTNINSFNALATIKTLNPVKYNFTNVNVPQLTFKPNTDYGFVAQQLETVYPELVDTITVAATYDSLGAVINPSKVLKTVNYKAMSALLVRSIQEQQLIIDSLRNVQSKQDSINQAVQQQLANLASQISSCCSNNSAKTANNASTSVLNQMDVELSDKDAIVLNQNVPNPFAEQTTITYNVPSSVGKAQLLFYNSAGQIIQTVDIKTRGKGKVNVFAADLSSGMYHYTLVADGQVVDSKKMVRE